MKFTKKDNLIIVGAGKIAYSLAPAISEAGYSIKSIISSNEIQAKELALKFNIKNYSDNPEDLRIKRGIFILAVPDSQIKVSSERYSKLQIDFPNSLFIHLSGSQDISLLKNLASKKAHTASFHIMQTFPSRKRRNIKNSFSAIETNSREASDYLFKLSKDLKLKPFQIESRNKVMYHLVGVYASNFINAVLFQSLQLFDVLGLKKYTFNDIFGPLYTATMKNIKLSSPAKALSGPIERGDLGTIKKHIKELRRISVNHPDIFNAYLALSLTLIEVTMLKSGKLQNRHIEIKELLIKELKTWKSIKDESCN